MSYVNGVTDGSITASYASYEASNSKKADDTNSSQKSSSTSEEASAVYEKSDSSNTSKTKKTYTSNSALVQQLQSDLANRQQQLIDIVNKTLNGQVKSYGAANDIWSILSSGNFTVDADTKAQAQADIAEDGYWGVNQTSSRILDFATALTGGDPDKIEKMRDAFKKGYAQAEKTWGGKLPDISSQTYQAVMDGFDKLASDSGITTEN